MSDKVQKERLDKCVAKLTGLSRKEASALIKEGRVLVDGKAALEAAFGGRADSAHPVWVDICPSSF